MKDDTPDAKYAGEPHGRWQRTLSRGLRRASRKRQTERAVYEELAVKPQAFAHPCKGNTPMTLSGRPLYPLGTCVFAQVADAECGRFCQYGTHDDD